MDEIQIFFNLLNNKMIYISIFSYFFSPSMPQQLQHLLFRTPCVGVHGWFNDERWKVLHALLQFAERGVFAVGNTEYGNFNRAIHSRGMHTADTLVAVSGAPTVAPASWADCNNPSVLPFQR